MEETIDVPAMRRANAGLRSIADKSLRISATFWFAMMVAGHAMFAFYIIGFYGGAAASGDLAQWNKVLDDHGYRAGDVAGTIFLGLHLLLAAVITIGGPLQLVPQLRAWVPGFHRWNGRLYIFTAFATTLSAFYLIATRGGTIAGPIVTAGIMLNGALILAFSVQALRHARARSITAHRRWALRAFIAVSGVWFFRVGMMFWFFTNQGPVGHSDAFDGPFDIFIAFGCYLVPLAVLELYLRVQTRGTPPAKLAIAALLSVLTVIMGIGIAMATLMMWLPRL